MFKKSKLMPTGIGMTVVLMQAKVVEINLSVARYTHPSDHEKCDTNGFILT